MADFEDAKNCRSLAKRGVTTAAKRLIGACGRAVSSDVTTALAVALETALEDFLSAHADYLQAAVDNGKTDSDSDKYKQEVYDKYNDAKTVLEQYKHDQLKLAAKPRKDRLVSSMKRLSLALDRAKTAVDTNDDIMMLECTKSDIDPCVNDMLENLHKMNTILSDDNLSDTVDDLVRSADEKRTDLHLKIASLARLSGVGRSSDTSMLSLLNMTPILNPANVGVSVQGSVSSSHTSTPTSTPTSTTATQAVSSTVTTNVGPPISGSTASTSTYTVQNTVVPQSTTPTLTHTVQNTVVPQSTTPALTHTGQNAIVSGSVSTGNVASQITSTSTQLNVNNVSSNATVFPMVGNAQVMQIASSLTQTSPQTTQSPSMQSHTYPHSLSSMVSTYSYNTPQAFGGMPVHSSATTLSQFGTMASQLGHMTPWPPGNYGQIPGNLVHHNMGSTPSHAPASYPVMGHTNPFAGYASPNFDLSMAPSSASSQHHIRKVELPDFFGDRRHWPEFKAVFKHLAESAYSSEQTLAYELKRHVKAPADVLIQSVYSTKPGAYQRMWQKLGDVYDDPGACISAALATLHSLEQPGEDFRSLVTFINKIEDVHAQLDELGQAQCVTVRDVDHINNLLPMSIKMEWNRKYRTFDATDKLQPFSRYMSFLEDERAAMARIADTISVPTKRTASSKKSVMIGHTEEAREARVSDRCILHPAASHLTLECNAFMKLTIKEKYDILRKASACFRCFLKHKGGQCKESNCETCGKPHNKMLCSRTPHNPKQMSNSASSMEQDAGSGEEEDTHLKTKSYATGTQLVALCPIVQVPIVGTKQEACVFLDGGSDASYVTFKCANRLGLKPKRKLNLEVTTMGNVEATVPTSVYDVPLKTTEGEIVVIEAYGMNEITGEVTKFNLNTVAKLFPKFDPLSFQREASTVDILIGSDNFGLHPKKELASSGGNLSIMSGRLGVCIQGTHKELVEGTKKSTSCARIIHGSTARSHTMVCALSRHPMFDQPQSHHPDYDGSTKKIPLVHPFRPGEKTESNLQSIPITTDIQKIGEKSPDDTCTDQVNTFSSVSTQKDPIGLFIVGEEMGTSSEPKCGSCKCGKCPLVGHTYSFVEQQELDMIKGGLTYDTEAEHWITSYPWLVDPKSLPNNYRSAVATLNKVERALEKDPKWASSYAEQIQDMIDRGVARKLSEEEMKQWSGPAFYLSHLAVASPKSASTPVRIVFNSSQSYKGISLNECLAKGPDSYANNILGILLRWREGAVAIVGDIRKMFHSIFLQPTETHCHRFLWRDLDSTKQPDVYVIERVNMGDRPASAIAVEALKATAEMNIDKFARAAEFVMRSSYVDDLIDSVESKQMAVSLARDTEELLALGGFRIKCWQMTGDETALNAKAEIPVTKLLKGDLEETAVLGVTWRPVEDTITYHVNLNFSTKRHGIHTEPDILVSEVPGAIPATLTRRKVLQQVMTIYDPMGIASPFTIQAKKLLRKTWEIDLGWDDPLPTTLHSQWTTFFTKLFELQNVVLPRCLKPEDATGDPWLILLSDGSETAYGFAAYIRWQLQDGTYWCRLIMAKSRIAPLHKVTTPRMELNGAVLSKRGRQVIESEMRFRFERVLHLVDSETVLNMLHKTSTRFHVYEGSRIGEIQAATKGNMEEWAWMPGNQNTADWLTRGKDPNDIGPDSTWWNGPDMFYKPFSQWELKFGKQNDDKLPGEKTCMVIKSSAVRELPLNLERFSSAGSARLVLARVLSMLRRKSFSGGQTKYLTPDLIRHAESLLVKSAQMEIHLQQSQDSGKEKSRYRSLNPMMGPGGLWVIGARLVRFNPMTSDDNPQIMLPTQHALTKLLMKEAHERGHLGRDGTLAKFREKYWTPHGDKLARSVKYQCQTCKLREAEMIKQSMGQFPEARLKPGPPFNHCMIDLLGPFPVRGEVQKRTTGKCYFVLFTDMTSRAVHIECVFGYDTSHFLLAFSRFVHIRGWPTVIYSDPGSQLVGAERELQQAWSEMDNERLIKEGAQSGTRWIFGPADSPWHQGAVESLVRTVKKCIKFAVHGQRLSAAEYLAVSYEIANMMNERLLGLSTSADSGVNLLTPNSLLLGRARARNPGGWLPEAGNVVTRFQLVTSVADAFWSRWCELYAPSLVRQTKWYRPERNLKPGDIVLIGDKNTLRGEYRLGKVKETFPGRDGQVRRVSLTYKNFKPGEAISHYQGAPDAEVTRAVQRLALLVPVDKEDEVVDKEDEPEE